MMMDAVIKTKAAPGSMEFASVQAPTITPDQVLVEIKASGICGTDHSLYHWSEAIASAYKIAFPRIFGHEFSGVIAEIGSQVKGLNKGDRVAVNPILYCGRCIYCAEGVINVCDNRPFLGTDYDGGFAKYVAVRAQNIVKLPDSVSFKAGALLEPLCVALHAVDRVRPRIGEVVVVMGAGAIGLLIVMVLKHLGVKRIFVTGLNVDKERLEFAKSLGADAINVEEKDGTKTVMELTGGRGAEVVFDAAGSAMAVQQAVKMVPKRGRIGVTGLPPKPSEIMMTDISLKEISLIGNRAYELVTWLQAVKMIAEGLNVEPIGTHEMPLKDFEKGMKLLDERKGLRIILIP
jgi:2-desacetyl-2-hydroxyethyl bacteriochlorophyllide A dehydrogenase